MNWLDIVIIILFLIFAISGIVSGLIKSLFSLIGLIVGIILAGKYYVTLSGHLSFISNESASLIAAYAIIFLAITILAAILGIILTKLVSVIMLGWINRLGGAILGIVLGAFFIAALLALWVNFSNPGSAVSNSKIASFLLNGVPIILALLPSEFDSIKNYFQ